MYCSHCGLAVPATAAFCERCSHPVDARLASTPDHGAFAPQYASVGAVGHQPPYAAAAGPYPAPYPGQHADPAQGQYGSPAPGQYSGPALGQYGSPAQGPYGGPAQGGYGGPVQGQYAGAPAGNGPSSALHWILPVGRSWQSIVAGYLALFAIVVWPLGPFALGMGVWALVRGAQRKTHGSGRAVFAVIVGLLTTLALAAVVLTL